MSFRTLNNLLFNGEQSSQIEYGIQANPNGLRCVLHGVASIVELSQ